MMRWVLGIEYNGTAFFGWQFQGRQRTVQQVLEDALTRVANQAIKVHCAGRTDTGVHALEQVVHFDTEAERSERAWVKGTNTHLPDDVRVLWVRPALDDFHARFSAIARFYRYMIFDRPVRSALWVNQTCWSYLPLDEYKMHQAAQNMLGEHDFSSFRAQSCQSVSPCRNMFFIQVYREQERVIIDLSANAFLHHMVRNIAGVLIEIGSGRKPVEWVDELLQIKDRRKAAMTASPSGLYLGGVYYPPEYGIQPHPVFQLLPENASRFEPVREG
jgi:tRNA pseudouridine38-40 synthase